MAIDARCPFCEKIYRLKDDLVGKKVTCANQDCRKVFQVTPTAKATVPQDADTIAAAALSDELPVPVPVESRTVAMTCVICEHKWSAPWDMQGKNVLCPDCKHRQKVPEQKENKPADWRTGGGGPSLRKIEKLEGVTSAADTAMVSGETLKATGIIDDGIEPLPLKVKLMRGAGVLAVLLAIAGGIFFWINSGRNKGASKVVDDFTKAAEAEDFQQLPLHRALLRLAGAEYETRQNDPEALLRGVDLYSKSLSDIKAVPKGADRDCLAGELALSLLNLGGDEKQMIDKRKIPWEPQPPKSGRAQIQNNAAEEGGVHRQLQRVLQAMKSGEGNFDVRAWTARRLARELIARKQLGILMSNLDAGFSPAEALEVKGQIALERYRAGDVEAAKVMADELIAEMANPPKGGPNPQSVHALWLLLKMSGPGMPPPATTTVMNDATRMTYTTYHVINKEPDPALQLANKAGPADERVRALSIGAELSETPAPFLDAAEKIVTEFAAKTDKKEALSAFPLLRLAIAAARAGDADKAGKFAKAIGDAPLRAYAEGEVLRYTLQLDRGKTAPESDAPLPAEIDAKTYLLGHAWGRYHLARHNGYNGDAKLARSYLDTWPKPLVAPFGAAGVMLGVQDKAVAP